MNRFWLALGLLLVGCAAVCTGVWLIYPPAAIVLAGLAVVGAALTLVDFDEGEDVE